MKSKLYIILTSIVISSLVSLSVVYSTQILTNKNSQPAPTPIQGERGEKGVQGDPGEKGDKGDPGIAGQIPNGQWETYCVTKKQDGPFASQVGVVRKMTSDSCGSSSTAIELWEK